MQKAHKRALQQYQRPAPGRLSPAEEEEVRHAFDLFDHEHRGRVDYRALKSACRALGFAVKKTDILAALERFDKDQQSEINFDIFYQVLLSFYQGRTFDDMVERAWQIFDSSNKGHITYSSLRSVVKEARQQIDDDELHDMIQCFDSDQDGQISKADFRKILRVYDPDHDPLDDDD